MKLNKKQIKYLLQAIKKNEFNCPNVQLLTSCNGCMFREINKECI